MVGLDVAVIVMIAPAAKSPSRSNARIDSCEVDFSVLSVGGPLGAPERLLAKTKAEVLPALSTLLDDPVFRDLDVKVSHLEIDLGVWPEEPNWPSLREVLIEKLMMALLDHLSEAQATQIFDAKRREDGLNEAAATPKAPLPSVRLVQRADLAGADPQELPETGARAGIISRGIQSNPDLNDDAPNLLGRAGQPSAPHLTPLMTGQILRSFDRLARHQARRRSLRRDAGNVGSKKRRLNSQGFVRFAKRTLSRMPASRRTALLRQMGTRFGSSQIKQKAFGLPSLTETEREFILQWLLKDQLDRHPETLDLLPELRLRSSLSKSLSLQVSQESLLAYANRIAIAFTRTSRVNWPDVALRLLKEDPQILRRLRQLDETGGDVSAYAEITEMFVQAAAKIRGQSSLHSAPITPLAPHFEEVHAALDQRQSGVNNPTAVLLSVAAEAPEAISALIDAQPPGWFQGWLGRLQRLMKQGGFGSLRGFAVQVQKMAQLGSLETGDTHPGDRSSQSTVRSAEQRGFGRSGNLDDQVPSMAQPGSRETDDTRSGARSSPTTVLQPLIQSFVALKGGAEARAETMEPAPSSPVNEHGDGASGPKARLFGLGPDDELQWATVLETSATLSPTAFLEAIATLPPGPLRNDLSALVDRSDLLFTEELDELGRGLGRVLRDAGMEEKEARHRAARIVALWALSPEVSLWRTAHNTMKAATSDPNRPEVAKPLAFLSAWESDPVAAAQEILSTSESGSSAMLLLTKRLVKTLVDAKVSVEALRALRRALPLQVETALGRLGVGELEKLVDRLVPSSAKLLRASISDLTAKARRPEMVLQHVITSLLDERPVDLEAISETSRSVTTPGAILLNGVKDVLSAHQNAAATDAEPALNELSAEDNAVRRALAAALPFDTRDLIGVIEALWSVWPHPKVTSDSEDVLSLDATGVALDLLRVARKDARFVDQHLTEFVFKWSENDQDALPALSALDQALGDLSRSPSDAGFSEKDIGKSREAIAKHISQILQSEPNRAEDMPSKLNPAYLKEVQADSRTVKSPAGLYALPQKLLEAIAEHVFVPTGTDPDASLARHVLDLLGHFETDPERLNRGLRIAAARLQHGGSSPVDSKNRVQVHAIVEAILSGSVAQVGSETPEPTATADHVAGSEDEAELAFTPSAGLVLLQPYFVRLFDRLGLLTPTRGLNRDRLGYAQAVLREIVGVTDTPWQSDPMFRVLLGLPTTIPLTSDIPKLDRDHVNLIDDLLRAVVTQWSRLGNTSPDGLRETFLLRDGVLNQRDDGVFSLRVSEGPFDMLLDGLPWTYSPFALPWMPAPLHVHWRDHGG